MYFVYAHNFFLVLKSFLLEQFILNRLYGTYLWNVDLDNTDLFTYSLLENTMERSNTSVNMFKTLFLEIIGLFVWKFSISLCTFYDWLNVNWHINCSFFVLLTEEYNFEMIRITSPLSFKKIYVNINDLKTILSNYKCVN